MTSTTLPARIAWRYLRAPKSHSAVSAISMISVVGVAVATAAIVCVLSVFNGFSALLNDSLDTLAPDVLVTPARGKVFTNADSLTAAISNVEGVEIAMPTVADNALAISDSREMPVRLRGVIPELYGRMTSVDSITIDGKGIANLPPDGAITSIGVARQLAINGIGGKKLFIFAPKRMGRVNLANPMSSFVTDSLQVEGMFQAMQSEYDENTVICDIGVARRLFQYDNEATQIEVKGREGTDPQLLAADIAATLGSQVNVEGRMELQEMNFRMVSIEKWITFLLLIFILMIASFNIISTLCMIIIEKRQSMATLSALGMTRRKIGRIFWWESMFVSLIGGLTGIAAGILLCLIQQQFGIIKLGGDPATMVVAAYPVKVIWSDIILASLPVVVIGMLTACIASAFAKSRIESVR